jgi:hypothetical protein
MKKILKFLLLLCFALALDTGEIKAQSNSQGCPIICMDNLSTGFNENVCCAGFHYTDPTVPCDITVCIGDSVSFTPTYIDTSFHFAWTSPFCPSATTISNNSYYCHFPTAGTYTVFALLYTVPSGGHCDSLLYEMHINVQPSATATILSLVSPVCFGEQTTLASVATNFLDPNNTQSATIIIDWGDTTLNSNYNNNFFPYTGNDNHTYQNIGTYTVTLYVIGGCDTAIATRTIQVLPPSPAFTFLASCRVNFFSDTLCDAGIISHAWDFGDPASGQANTSTSSNPTHVFTLNNHSYTVTHTIVTNSGTYSYSTTVIQVGGPSAAINGFATNNCGNGTLLYSSLCQANTVYTWTVVGGVGTVSSDGCSIDVNWTDSTGGAALYLVAWDSITDCYGYDTILIPPCCEYATPIEFANRTASSVLADPNFAPYVNGSDFQTNSHIVINGVFTVDVPFTFNHCGLIDMGPNAAMIVQPNQTLTFDSSITDVKCNVMWDGIYIQGNTATLNVINQSVLQQAKQAVVSENGGVYFIENSTLQNNYRDMVVKAYALPHTGIVRNTRFTMNSSFFPAYPALPFGHTRTICGIEIEGNADIKIGDASQSLFQNDFTNIMVGVRSTNSIAKIENCRFAHFVPTLIEQTNINDAGTGVVAIGSKNYNYQPAITVGGNTVAERCVFLDLRYGIFTKNQLHVTIKNNNILETKLRAVSAQNIGSKNITVEKNFISNNSVTFAFQTGIYVVDVPYSVVNIRQNQIIQTSSVNSQIGTGIHVGMVSPSDATVNIANNSTITRVKTGIYLVNLIGQYNVKVSSNFIGFSKPNANYTSAHYGIRVSGCSTALCDTNTVMKTGASPSLAMVQNLRGISIENSPNTFATDNIFVKMGSGIFGYEISSSSTLACNTLNTCYHGVYFTGTAVTNNACDIGDQVIDPNGMPAATGNTWFTNVAIQELIGAVDPPALWHWDNIQPINAVINLSLQQENYNACNLFFLQPIESVLRDKEVGYALRTAADSNTSAETSYTLYRYAYRRLEQMPNWLSLGTPDDSVYQNFFNSFDPTNIGFFSEIEAASDTGNYTAVMSAANGMSSANLIEYNLKQVYLIYAASWLQGKADFSPSDSAMLWNIALQDPAEGGTGVYSARVLLGLDVDDYGASNLRLINGEEENQEETSVNNAFIVYPVPTTDNLTLEYPVNEGQAAQVEMYDLTGKRVIVEQLQPLNDVYTFDLAGLPEGVYMLRVVVDGVSTNAKRIVLIK